MYFIPGQIRAGALGMILVSDMPEMAWTGRDGMEQNRTE